MAVKARKRAVRQPPPPPPPVCRCKKDRPLTIATWRGQELVSVIRHHWRRERCELPDEPLDLYGWQPRPAHTDTQTTEGIR